MRIVAAAAVCFLISVSLVGQVCAQDSKSKLAENQCKIEDKLLESWRERGVVYLLAYKGPEGIMFVHTNSWRRISSQLQKRLAVAAYCPIGMNFERGRLEVSGRLGPTFGAVEDGLWQNGELTP